MGFDRMFTVPVATAFAAIVKATEAAGSISPVLTASVLYALTRAPQRIRDPLIARLRQHLSPKALRGSIAALKILLGLGLAKQLHLYLESLAQNNFRFTSERHRYDWPNEIAVVTGAAGGIGGAITRDLTAKGVKVIAIDISDELPVNLKGNSKVFYYKCDITSRSAVLSIAQQIRSEHGNPSILVNNAGVAYTHHTLNCSEKAINQLYNVNIMSHYWTLQAFLPAMIEQKKGHIVSMASMASFHSGPGFGPYSATKAAVLSLHESLSDELRQIHHVPEIKLSIVHPCFVETPMTASILDKLRSQMVVLRPEDVSGAVMNNIFQGKGGQLVLNGSLPRFLTVFRGFPNWLGYSLLYSRKGGSRTIADEEKKAGPK